MAAASVCTALVPYDSGPPTFQVNDMVQWGEGWEWTGQVRRVMPTKDGPVYAVRYFMGRQARWKYLSGEQLKLRMREVK